MYLLHRYHIQSFPSLSSLWKILLVMRQLSDFHKHLIQFVSR